MPIIHRQAFGFTLIEMLVVIVIISILAGLITLNTNGLQGDLLRSEANRLHGLIRQLEDDAVLLDQELSINFYRDNDSVFYSFYFFDYESQTWGTMQNAVYRARQLPSWLSLSLENNGSTISPGLLDQDNSPDLFFFSSGEKNPFTLSLTNGSNDNNQITLLNDGVTATQIIYQRL